MGLAELEFTRKLIDMGNRLNELQDEITRLRAAMPADVLREYERRKDLAQRPVCAERRDVEIPVPPRSGETPAAAQDLGNVA